MTQQAIPHPRQPAATQLELLFFDEVASDPVKVDEPVAAPPVPTAVPVPVLIPEETTGLTDLDLRILDLERRWFHNMGAKEAAITRELNMTATRYFQILNGLIEDPRAMHAQPQLISRLRRVRAARQRSRSHCSAVLRQRRQRAAF